MILKFGSKGSDVLTVQKQLIQLGYKDKSGKAIAADGDFGANTEDAVIQFQKTSGLTADGKVGEKTQAALSNGDISKFLKDDDFKKAAERLKIPEIDIRAFAETESNGMGFLSNNKAKILFERHKMYQYLVQFKNKTFATEQMKKNPNIVNTATGGYKGKTAEYTRLSLAKNIHEEAALMSCSWGMFQIMGENWQQLGYTSIFDFVERMQSNESQQLEAFIRFIETKKGLLTALQKKDWESVFRLYNGANYKKLGYQTKFQSELDHLESIYGEAQVA